MVGTMMLPIMIAAPACPVPPQKIPVTITALAPAAIGAVADPRDAGVQRVGPFAYQGNGIVIRSGDRRIADLVLDQRFDLEHRCGNPVLPPSPWIAPRTGPIPGAMEVQAIPAGRVREGHHGATGAQRLGISSVLAGHVAGPSWPVFTGRDTMFLGLMYPTGKPRESRLVAFRNEPGDSRAVSLAVIPMRLQVVNVIPGLHEPASYLYLAALGPTEMVQITLRMDAAAGLAVEAMLNARE